MATEVKVELSGVTDFGIHDGSCKQITQSVAKKFKGWAAKLVIREIQTNPNLSYLVICFHFCPLNCGHCGYEQIVLCDGASAPPQTSLVADNLLPAKHMPEVVQIKSYLDIR